MLEGEKGLCEIFQTKWTKFGNRLNVPVGARKECLGVSDFWISDSDNWISGDAIKQDWNTRGRTSSERENNQCSCNTESFLSSLPTVLYIVIFIYFSLYCLQVHAHSCWIKTTKVLKQSWKGNIFKKSNAEKLAATPEGIL